MFYECIPTMLVLLTVQDYTLRKWVVSFSAIIHMIPHTVFSIDTSA
jgi:hypothetical protein